MKNYIKIASVFIALFIAFQASAQNSQFIGKWLYQYNEKGVESSIVYTFQPSGKVYFDMEVKMESPHFLIEGIGTGNYTYSDGTLSFKIKSNDFDVTKFIMEGATKEMIDAGIKAIKKDKTSKTERWTNVRIENNVLKAYDVSTGKNIELIKL